MTDEEIIELAEKTRKERYCTQNTICVCEKPAIYDCNSECPIAYCDDCNTLCGDTIYEQGFLDGFKAAMSIVQKVREAQIEMMVEKIRKGESPSYTF